MKQFAVRSLGLGVTLMALIQLPVLASSRVTNLSVDTSVESSLGLSLSADEPPQLLAQIGLASRSLRLGDEGADVRALQRYLSRNGLYSFGIDGVYGENTATAVAIYQRRRDLSATGIADEETLRDMEFEFLPGAQSFNSGIPLPPSRAANTVRSGGRLAPGSVGSDVIALQERLNDVGIPVRVDGDYGRETEEGVRDYQWTRGLNVTGTADSDTLRAMGFSSSFATSSTASPYPYVAAVIGDSFQLASVQTFFPDAYIDRDRRGTFINIGNFAERFPAEAKVNAAKARGFNTRVLYRR